MENPGLIRVRTMMPMSRRDVMKGAAAAGAVAAAGLPGRSAEAKTVVSLFGWQGYDEGLRVDDFLAKNDIEVNFTPIGNNDEIITRLAGGGVGQMDLVTPYMGYIPLMVAADLLDPIDESLVPNLAKVPEVFRNDSNVVINGTRYSVPFTWGAAPMAYDPAVFPTPPTSWKEILKDEYKGKVGMMDDPIGNQMLAAIMATDAKVATQLTMDQLNQATDFLIDLKKNHIRQMAASWGELADALARTRWFEEAIEQYHRALEMDPDSAKVRTNLGAALMSLSRDNEAVAELQRALLGDPAYAPAHLNLGLLLGFRGQTQSARSHLLRALKTSDERSRRAAEAALSRLPVQ